MSDIWIANASPVIVLAQCGYLDLLTKLGSEVVIPLAVVEEITAGPPSDPARAAIESGWGDRAAHQLIPTELLEWGLGPGETSVLALAQERTPSVAVLDDAAARTCAKVIGVPVIGSIGVIARAKRQGHVQSATEALRAFRSAGLYMSDEVIEGVLRSLGEI